MDVARTLIFPILVLACLPAFGQTVHRCRSGDTWVYQDRPCSGEQTDAGTHTIRATKGGDTPPAVKELLSQARAKAERERDFAALAAAQAPSEPAVSAPAPRRGYRCIAGRGFRERVVYQTEPCPELMETGAVRISQTTVDERGMVRTESVTAPIMEETEEKEISPSDVCEGQRAQQDPYQRYRNPRRCP